MAPPAAAWTVNPPVDSEHVEDPLPAGQFADGQTIEPLIEEVTGLLAGLDVGFEGEVTLAEQDRSVGDLADDHVAVVEPVRLDRLQVAGETQDDRVDAGRSQDTVDHRTEVGIPDLAVQLDHADVVVAIDHEPRQAVVFTVHGAIARSVHRTTTAHVPIEDHLAPGHRRSDPVGEPGGIDRDGVADVDHPQPDRRVGIPEPDRRELAVAIEHDPDVTRRAVVVVDRLDRAVVHPRVTAADPAQRIGCHPDGQPPIGRRREPVEQAAAGVHDRPGDAATTATIPTLGSTAPAYTSAHAVSVASGPIRCSTLIQALLPSTKSPMADEQRCSYSARPHSSWRRPTSLGAKNSCGAGPGNAASVGGAASWWLRPTVIEYARSSPNRSCTACSDAGLPAMSIETAPPSVGTVSMAS